MTFNRLLGGISKNGGKFSEKKRKVETIGGSAFLPPSALLVPLYDENVGQERARKEIRGSLRITLTSRFEAEAE